MNKPAIGFALTLPLGLSVAQTTRIVPSPAYATIQSAVTAAVNRDTVLVLPGVYRENLDIAGKDITIRGRDGADATTIDGSANPRPTVAYPAGSTRACVLEGVTVTGGSNPGAFEASYGGGIRIEGASPTIRRCVVRGNWAGSRGGGIGVAESSTAPASPLVENCTIEDNASIEGGGVCLGKGQSSSLVNSPEIRHCIIRRNVASRGGGLAVTWVGCVVDSTRFYDNVAHGTHLENGGGGILIVWSSSVITNNRIYRNVTSSTGGGIKYINTSAGLIANNTIVGNRGGGICAHAIPILVRGVTLDVVNCIVWGNGSGPEFVFTGTDHSGAPPTARVSFSDVAGGLVGTGNIDVDPALLNAGSGNHRLRGDSRCIDAGTTLPALPRDFEGDLRPSGGGVDIGADEYVASKVLHAADRFFVATTAPTDVLYRVAGGTGRAGSSFAVLMSLRGTEPGVEFAGLHLPLNPDSLTAAIVLTGVLDATGLGAVVLRLGSLALPASLAGRTLSSAAIVLAPGPTLAAFSNDDNVLFVR